MQPLPPLPGAARSLARAAGRGLLGSPLIRLGTRWSWFSVRALKPQRLDRGVQPGASRAADFATAPQPIRGPRAGRNQRCHPKPTPRHTPATTERTAEYPRRAERRHRASSGVIGAIAAQESRFRANWEAIASLPQLRTCRTLVDAHANSRIHRRTSISSPPTTAVLRAELEHITARVLAKTLQVPPIAESPSPRGAGAPPPAAGCPRRGEGRSQRRWLVGRRESPPARRRLCRNIQRHPNTSSTSGMAPAALRFRDLGVVAAAVREPLLLQRLNL
jgi:hypothetical protein